MFFMGINMRAIGSIPYLDGSIIAGSGETATIGRPGDIAHSFVMSTIRKQDASGGGIKNLCRGVRICQGEATAIRRPGNGRHPI